jgi:MFS family permease
MVLTPQRRNVLVLALCQAMTMTSITIMVTVSSLVGQELADDKASATWPLGLQQIGVMLATFPASLLMRRFGRRAGFTIGAAVGVSGALIQAYAVFHLSFWLFCLGNGLVGVANGFSLFYRFAATDTADAAFKSKAISLVMAGGVVAALLGPQLAKWSHDWFAPVFFAGSFLAIAALQGLGGLLVQFVRIPRPTAQERSISGRPLIEIVRQPVFLVAVSGSMIGYGVMSLVMTATPLAMVECGFSFADSTFVIQWHVLGMFVPSFFTGHLIARFGVLKIMLAGAGLFAGCVALNLSGIAIWQFWSALILLGLGWNFLYIGGSTLLTEAYLPEERTKTQAVNDFLVFGMVTIASFASGALHHNYGWTAVNLGVIVPVALVCLAILWLLMRRHPAAG